MPRAIWSGAISFGLVNIPVKLYSAVSRKTVRFHQIDAESGARVRQKRVPGRGGKSNKKFLYGCGRVAKGKLAPVATLS